MTKLYGLKVSYFTGKMEAYLKYKEIPHEFCEMSGRDFQGRIRKATGAMQMPAMQLADGRWMTDTTPMIDYFETLYTEHPILPTDPVQSFICRLIEDYADEWMWRPAMHYRWSYAESAHLLRRQIADAMGIDVKAPGWVKRYMVNKRQHRNFVVNDGVNDQTWNHVERSYLYLLELLQTIFDKRPFILGDRPTLADIGLMGPLLRHFSMDPTPAKIMRETAPAVMEWVYRMWNARASRMTGDLVEGVPDDLLPLLKEIGETHLEYLCGNALAWQTGQDSFAVTVQGVPYSDVPVSRYRVWCLEKLQEHFRTSDAEAQGALKTLLDRQGCLDPLLRIERPNSGYDGEGKVPFCTSIPVYADVR